MARLLVLLALIGFDVACLAKDQNCAPYHKMIESLNLSHGLSIFDWKCSALTKYRLKSSSALPLVAVWGYGLDEQQFATGHYLFVGEAQLSGVVTRTETESLGDTVTFSASEQFEAFLPSVTGALSFQNDVETAVQKFDIPDTTNRRKCVAAPATIILRRLYVNAGYGGDTDGSFPLEYKVLKVGKFRKCG